MNNPIAELNEKRKHIVAELEKMKAALAVVDAELVEVIRPALSNLKSIQGKEHGTFNIDGGAGLKIKVTIDKRVNWDGGLLKEIYDHLPQTAQAEIFEVSYKIPEKTYQELQGDLKAQIDRARTVKYGEPRAAIEEIA